MSFQNNKTILENAFNVLKQQSASTAENWNDQVQRKFYDQFIDSFPKEFHAFLSELSKLDKSFENAEQVISSL